MESASEKGKRIERDESRFTQLYTNSRAKIPENYSAPLSMLTTSELIGKRVRTDAAQQK